MKNCGNCALGMPFLAVNRICAQCEKESEWKPIAREPQTKPTTISFNWLGMLVEVNGIFKPARQAPACSNPDSAAFSDSGEPAEVDIWSAWFVGDVDRVPIKGEMLDQLREDSDLPRLLGLEK